MENDIICVTEHIEIHPMDNSDWYAVVRDGSVVSRHQTLKDARDRADELATAQ